MIKHLRIDDRLIHGEVIAMWIPNLGIDTIVVADINTATSKMMTMAAKLAKPKGIDMEILTLDDAIVYLNEESHDKKKILVVCSNPKNALYLVKECKQIKEVNLGAIRQSGDKKQVNLRVFVDQDDITVLKAIEDCGCVVYQETKPGDKKNSIKDLIGKIK